ncbi:MAG: YraN family protein [Terriglobales bacterium]|jgi:putative endonuclease
MYLRGLQNALRSLNAIADVVPWGRKNKRDEASHLRTGQRGEDDAYFWLRRHGYVVVARNWRSSRHRGELDLIGWDESVLCFVEVKTRNRRDVVTAEAAVDFDKQRELRAVAGDYLRRYDPQPAYRFDVMTVYNEPGREPQITLLRNAFAVRMP